MRFFVTTLLCVLSYNVLLAQNEPDWNKLDTYFKRLEENDRFMGGIAIYKGEKRLYEYYAGLSCVEENKHANYQTRYRIGSTTKIFTATLIFQLVEEGLLTLDTKLSDYYPQLPNAEKITISHLLNHRSGLHNYATEKVFTSQKNKPWRKGELMGFIVNLPIDFEPGEKAEYSDTNYLLLGFIIERLKEESYAMLLDKNICKPNIMTGTGYGGIINTNLHGAHSYVYRNKQWERLAQTDISITQGAGGVCSTPRDMNIFIQALFQNRVVSANSVDSIISLKDGFGRGVFEYSYNDKKAWGHSGIIDGFQSHVSYFPADTISISVLGNGLYSTLNEVIITALNTLESKEYKLPEFGNITVDISHEILENLEGNYRSDTYPKMISLVLNDNKLYAQTSGYTAYPLTAYENGSFRFDPVGIEIKFEGNIHAVMLDEFVLYQRGAAFKFEKEQ